MALTSWKAFNFFDVSSVKLPEESSSIFSSDISSLCTGSSNLFLGSTDGFVHLISPSFKLVRSFNASEGGPITHIKQIEGTSLLVTIADDASNEPALKVWALDKTEKKTGDPKCLSTTPVQNARRPFPISAFAAVPDLSQVAVGFANGSVAIIRGDLIHDRGARQRIVFESEEPITGLEIHSGPTSILYISTTNRILALVIAGRGQGQPARVLEDTGCALGCMALDKDNGDVLVAREDAIYTYGPHGRGPSYAFDSPKNSINIFKDYVALVCPPKIASSNSGTLRNFDVSQPNDIFSTTTFTLLDTDLKFIAHSEALVSPVKQVFIEWGDLFILTTDGKIYRYREKSLQQKLEILYQRSLYILAINLAQKKGVDTLQQNAIYRKYGDFLYQRGDYDTAMQQYLRAIDNTEPSQVIRKYLDTQRIHNLIEYLEELHDHDRATVDHTTLLLNCYAKLKDTGKLDEFIKAPGELKFDLETAIAMCRQGGYYEQAAYLATKYGENDMVVDILIEDSKKYAEAVEYIWRLDPELAYFNLMKYARVLLSNCPQRTTDLFIEYYKGKYKPITEVQNPPEPQAQSTSTLQSLAAFLPLPLMNSSAGTKTEAAEPSPEVEDKVADDTPVYQIPKPRTAFSAFVGHPQEFITFLEALISQESLKEEDKVDLYTTLFEMYLDTASRKKATTEKDEWETKAKKLIEGKDIPISTSSVLLLSDLSGFREGSTLVREQEGLRSDIFRSFTSAKDTRGAIQALKKYGPEEPQLYVDALTYFASSPKILEEAGEELDVVLKRINDEGLMSPLQVIQALSNNAVVTMGRVKKYLSDNIERERKEISTNRRLISSYSTETENKRKELEQLGSKPVVFQARRCALKSCGGVLDLPTVHFLCKHSFHQRCLNKVDEEAECPVCAPQNSTIRAIRKRQVESADQHELFKGELQRSKDGFGVIGSMMTEIGLAQQRLLDDDAQYANRHLPPHTTLESEPCQPTLPHMDDIHLVPVVDVNGPQHIDYNNIGVGPEHMYQTNDTITHQYEPIAHTEQHHPQSLLSTDFSQSAASYNLFESSLQPSRSSNHDPMSFLRPDDALQIDLQNGARRWNSMQGMPSSPHDTEPNSSLLSPRASRSRSDNAGSNGILVPHPEVHQPAEPPDKLPRTIIIETPAEPKKRGRPKKQTPAETVETPDVPRAVNQDTSEANNTKPEKRKPGRPPKNPKPDAERNDFSNTDDQSTLPDPTTIILEPQVHPTEPDLPTLPADIPQNNTTETTNFHIEIPKQQSPPQQAPTETLQTPEPAPKKSKKKKLKRGKTTSVTLHKTYDPDAEDDVIWIDDTPPNPVISHTVNSEVSHPTVPTNNGQTPSDNITVQPDPAPQPKKRGRKRKKTSDPVIEGESKDKIEKPSDTHVEQDQQIVSVTVDNTTNTTVNKNTVDDSDILSVSHDLQAGSEDIHSETTPVLTTNENPPETPKKSDSEPKTPSTAPGAADTDASGKGANKGPGKHSPISMGKVPYRVGLSRKARIAPLLKIVRR
ncbi:hypothetical protein BDV36DRAFT_286514 [Aspergillus pseudocaelatus]|uniref:RING-type E3 ubiquitin transferase n=1 Tax=Aspergillus pseudocaelatus TaxID=1825620 RepID=A0ABQ6WD62_9EURO|nr:hypothetical protein BDV36DRAFT_286514 [Aspergillus pseudocaelatus]